MRIKDKKFDFENSFEEPLLNAMTDILVGNSDTIVANYIDNIKDSLQLSDLYSFVTDCTVLSIVHNIFIFKHDDVKDAIKILYTKVLEVILPKYGLDNMEYISVETLKYVIDLITLYKHKMLPSIEDKDINMDILISTNKSDNSNIYELYIKEPKETNPLLVVFTLCENPYETARVDKDYDIYFQKKEYKYNETIRNSNSINNKDISKPNVRDFLYAITMPKKVISKDIIKIFEDTIDTLYNTI